jgi:hypothetical protein
MHFHISYTYLPVHEPEQLLVVEHREVESTTETNGVSNRNVGSCLVSLKDLVGTLLAFVACGEFGEVTVIITHPVRLKGARQYEVKSIRIRIYALTSYGKRPWIRQKQDRAHQEYLHKF